MNNPRQAIRLVSAPPAGTPNHAGDSRADAGHATLSANAGPGIFATPVANGSCPGCGAANRFDDCLPLAETTCTRCGRPLMVPGRLGGFTLLERIGEGEMGEIYRARDEALHRDVAIKVVRDGLAADEAQHVRLQQEAQAAARVSHPHVAQVHALGFSNRYPYLVMELVRGENMEERLRRDGTIAEQDALRAAIDVADGLTALHRCGTVHGDIKPANIVLNGEGAAKLVDFGLAGMSRRDGCGAIHGTPHYIAPELVKGARDCSQTDMYSLGATLYHMLAGVPPFTGATPAEVIRARLQAPPEPIGNRAPWVSATTRRIVMRLLERDPANRYADCGGLHADLLAAFEALAPSASPSAEPEDAAPLPRPPARRHRRRLVHGALSFSVVALLAALLLHPQSSIEPDDDAPVPSPLPPPGARTVPELYAPGDTPPPPAAAPAPRTFDRLLTPNWFSIDLGTGLRGSTVWRSPALILMSDGLGFMAQEDSCRYVHAGVTGDFALTADLITSATTAPEAQTGILVRQGRDPSAPGLFFGVLGDGRLTLQTRHGGRTTNVHVSDAAVFFPCRLRLTRLGDRFLAAVSGDADNWQPAAQADVPLREQIRVGVAIASRVAGKLATAEFRELTLRVPGQAVADSGDETPADAGRTADWE